jgi:radical SAM superfamily enzyme YgiQ (UPF0313 family)
MNNVYLAQFSAVSVRRFLYFPYAAGLVWAYAQTDPVVTANYELKRILWRKGPIDEVVNSLENPQILGLSSYVWSLNYNHELAKAVKKRYPNCMIVHGGPGVPDKDYSYFKDHPYIDLCVHKEGEQVFTAILHEFLKDSPDYSQVKGVSYAGPFQTHYTAPAERIQNLDPIPSPYLIGLFDDLADEARRENIEVNALLETNRGCPFSCTFCDWGGLTHSKVKRFDIDRLKAEIDWFAKNKIEMLSLADANFGIFPERDYEIAKYCIEVNKRTGYPVWFDTSWTKVTKPETLRTAKMLLDAGMLRKFVMSSQSLSEETLQAIKRVNLSGEVFDSFIEDRSISTATELICGLPGETVESFKKGLEFFILKDVKIITNPLSLLPNSEMSTPEYVEKWKIRYKRIESTWGEYGIPEYEDLVIETSTFTVEEWEHMLLWSWFTVFMETYYWTDMVSRKFDLIEWYDWLLDYMLNNPNPLHFVLNRYRHHLDDERSYELWGGSFTDIEANQALIDYKDTTWPDTLRQMLDQFCEEKGYQRIDETTLQQQLNRQVVLTEYNYRDFAHQLVHTRWSFLSRRRYPGDIDSLAA